jgi:hypothetical protein
LTDEAWRLAGEYAFYAFTGATVLFILLYGVLAPWWRSATGRNIMTLMGALAVACVYFTWAYVREGGLPPAFLPIRFCIFVVLFLAVSWRVVLFVREQIFARRRIPSDERTTK